MIKVDKSGRIQRVKEVDALRFTFIFRLHDIHIICALFFL